MIRGREGDAFCYILLVLASDKHNTDFDTDTRNGTRLLPCNLWQSVSCSCPGG